MDDRAIFLEAARIVRGCPKKRLPAVLELLKRAGVDVDRVLVDARPEKRVVSMQERRVEKREREYDPSFWKSDDAFVQRLRDAYADGVCFTRVSEMTGLSRVSLYRYLHGKSTPCKADAERVLSALDTLCPPKL